MGGRCTLVSGASGVRSAGVKDKERFAFALFFEEAGGDEGGGGVGNSPLDCGVASGRGGDSAGTALGSFLRSAASTSRAIFLSIFCTLVQLDFKILIFLFFL